MVKLLINKTRRAFQLLRLCTAGLYFQLFVKQYTNKGVTLNIPQNETSLELKGTLLFNEYEADEAEYLHQYLSPKAKVLELGGCLGYVSCLINKILSNKKNQVVLEANPELIPWLEKNKDENDCGFEIENSIISKQKSNVFNIDGNIHASSIKHQTNQKINIKGVKIKDLEEKYNIEFDTLILDIEGGELKLFREHMEKIAKFDKIFFEIHDFNAKIMSKEEGRECEELLEDHGFEQKLKTWCYQVWEKAA
jgi:FkbM family methyltransferase